jgi:hypothetical protein
MKQRAPIPNHRLSTCASLLATGALLAACGGGGGGTSDSADKSLAAAQPSGQAASAAAADSASTPASGAALAASAPASGAQVSAVAVAAATKPGATAAAGVSSSTTPAGTQSSTAGTAAGTTAGATSGGTTSTAATVAATTAATTAAAAATAGPTAKIAAVRATATAIIAGDALIYVETTGNDANTGAVQASTGADGPVKTIARAQQLARTKIAAMVAGTTPRVAVHVVIGPGEYPLASTLNFTTADSGTSAAPVSYEARQNGTVLISGGVSLGSQAAPAAATAISYAAPADTAAMAGGAQLYINGRRATLARQPNAGDAWFVQRAVPLTGEVAGTEGSMAFAPSAANLAWISALSAADKKRAIVDIYQAWTDGRHRLSDQATPAGSVRITPKTMWPFLSMGGVSQRFFVENVMAAFDAPGEWIYDSGAVRYIRRADEVGAQLKATLPVLDRLVVVQGTATTPVQSLQFSGLTFGYTRYLTPDAGLTDGQAAYSIPAAIEVNKTRGFLLDNCSVYRTAGWAVWLRDGVRDSQVSNSSFTDLGAGGVKVGLSAQSPTDTGASGANQVIGNTVAETGKLFPGAVAIWLGQTWDNSVQMNTVYNTTYTGISVGWSWGYATATSGRNLIKGNLLYNIGQRNIGDIAGIYTLGQSPGTVISNNIIRSVRGYTGYGAGAWGIYNDEGTTGVLMENNVILGTDNGAYHIHYGNSNIVRGNVMAGGDVAEVRVTRLDTTIDASLQNNLIAPKVLQPFDQYAQAPSMGFAGNEVSPTLSGAGLVLTKCGTGCTLGTSSIQSTTAPTDIRSTNPTWTAVIANAVAAWSGVPAGTQLTAKLAAANLPPVADAPTALVAPAVDFVADIAGSAINSRPLNMVYLPKGDTVAIRVETQADSPNGKCLAFNDGATFANRWEPYAYAQLNYTSGTTTVDFEIKLDASSVMLTEWRDNATTYLTGPSMRITSAGVAVNGVVVAPITVGAWTKFHITSVTGTPGSKWSLDVTRSSDGQKTSVSNLAPKDAGWKQLNWLGFISDTAATSRPCIATLKAANVTQ